MGLKQHLELKFSVQEVGTISKFLSIRASSLKSESVAPTSLTSKGPFATQSTAGQSTTVKPDTIATPQAPTTAVN